MPLPLPNLDDRTFEQLVAEATQRIRQSNTAWDDLAPSDPGVVMLEVFAYLTDTMIYRLNRLPSKVYVAFLRLLGVSLHPPSAASVTLQFSRARGADGDIVIPRGTRVTLQRSGGSSTPPIFMTTQAATLAQGSDSVSVPAIHAEQVEAEQVGAGTGLPGLSLTVQNPPLIYGTGDPLDLIVGVEAAAGELGDRVPAIQFDGKPYRIWREVENFANPGADRFVYTVDRMSGAITFAPAVSEVDPTTGTLSTSPAALGEIPAASRAIRVWYRHGGGADGNIAANTLSVLKDSIRGLTVSNPAPATGGRAAETLDNALLRGPKELHALQRAVTADDFELLALKALDVARAKAFTRASLWSYAQRGTVEVLLVPDVPESAWQGDWLAKATLMQYATEPARAQVQSDLDTRRPLGTTCLVNWAHYKEVRVTARIVVRREEDPDAVKGRVLKRLHHTINPLPSAQYGTQGWPFGQALRVSNVYDVALSEPGVRWVENVALLVDEVPDAVTTVAADSFQANTWYVGSTSHVFRSLNDGDGWETAVSFADGEIVERIEANPYQAGYVAASTRVGDTDASHVYVSADCGETWLNVTNTDFHVEDLAWMRRDNQPVLLLATDKGLYELDDINPNSSILQILVDPNNQALNFYAVTTAMDVRGGFSVAVAAQNSKGVYLSSQAGKSNTFRVLDGMQNLDVRVLAVQVQGARSWLWAGTFAFGDDGGKGVYRWELRGDEDPVTGWETFNANWKAGSCRALTFSASGVIAATHRGGVLRLDPTVKNPQWQTPNINSGLPIRDLTQGRFVTVDSIAANPAGTFLLAGIAGNDDQTAGKGVYAVPDQGANFDGWKFTLCSTRRFTDKVTLPESWLFASGAHAITVESEDEAT